MNYFSFSSIIDSAIAAFFFAFFDLAGRSESVKLGPPFFLPGYLPPGAGFLVSVADSSASPPHGPNSGITISNFSSSTAASTLSGFYS